MIGVACLLVVCGCKSGQGKADKDPAEQRVEPAVELPFQVPADTVALLRADLRQVERAYGHGDELARLAAEAQRAGSSNQIPHVNAPAKLSLAFLMAYPREFRGSFDDPENLPNTFFDGLAEQGTVYAAVSVAGNEPLLRAMENQVPMSGAQTIPRGLFVRMWLPADDPEALSAWLKSSCEQRRMLCGAEYRAESRQDGVLFEFRRGDVERLFERAGLSAELPEVEDDPSFLEDPTPALRAFSETESVFGWYVKSERLPMLGAYVGMTEAFQALQTATPENRIPLYARGMQLAGQTFALLSPESREVSDSAFFVRTSEQFGFYADVVASLTELGATVSDAGDSDTDATTIETGGMFEAEFAYDVSAAKASAVTPWWMRMGGERDNRRVMEQLRIGGIWTYLIGGHNYPAGFSRGLSSLAIAAGGESALVTTQMEYLEAARVSLTAVENKASPFGVEPRGGLVAVFDGRADLEGYVERGRAQLSGAPFPVELELVERDGLKEVRILVGSDIRLGEPESIPAVLQATLDMAAVGQKATQFGANSGQIARMAEQTGAVLDKVQTMRMTTTRNDAAVHARMTMGAAEPRAFELSGNARPVPQPTADSTCLSDVRQQSADAMRAREKASPGMRAEMYREVAQELAASKDDCSEYADEIDWMRAQWLRSAGMIEANGLRFDRASKDFEQACELDDEDACPMLGRARAPDHGVEFAQLDAPVSTWVPFGSIYTVVRADQVERWTFDWPMGLPRKNTTDISSLDWNRSRDRERVAGLLGNDTNVGFPMLVDRAADAYVVALMADEAGAVQAGVRRFRRSNNRQVGLLVPVRVDGRSELGLLKLFPVTDGDAAPMKLRLEKDGLSIVAPGREDLPVDEVSDILGELDKERPPRRITIEVSPGVPFAELARLYGELEQEWTTDQRNLTIALTASEPSPSN
jgi:hypothetical protein